MKKKRQFRHLNQSDRDRIEALLRAGHSQKDIAIILKVDKGTVSREIKKRKRKDGRYEATVAHHKANVKRSNSKYQGMKIETYPTLRDFIIKGLKDSRSPDEIAGRMKRELVSPRITTNAIYKWLYSVYGEPYCAYLCTKRKRKKTQRHTPKREMIPERISIRERPTSPTLHHWEGDTLVSPKTKHTTASVAVVCAILEKYICATKLLDLKPARMSRTIRRFTRRLHMDTLTLDNGIENRYHERFGVDSFFCDSHSPWQKPLVENSIGLARRWFLPKGTDLSLVSEETLQTYITILNNKYRKSLNYQSAYEVAIAHGILKRN